MPSRNGEPPDRFPPRRIGSYITDISPTYMPRNIEELLQTWETDVDQIYRLTAEQLPDMIFILNHRGDILAAQGNVQGVIGYSRDELRGKNLSEICEMDTSASAGDPACLLPFLRRFQEGVREDRIIKDYSITVRTRRGEIRHLELNGNGIYSPLGKFLSICVVARDVSLRKRLQDRIDYLRQLNEKILNSLREGMLVLEVPDLRLLNVNRSFLDAFRLVESQIIGNTCEEIYRQFGRPKLFTEITRLVQRTLAINKVTHHEYLAEDIGPTTVYLELIIHPIGLIEGQTRQIMVLVRDITPRKRYEIELKRRIQKLSTLNDVSEAFHTTIHRLDNLLYCLLVGVTAGKGLGFNRAFVLLVDESAGLLKGRLAVGPGSGEEAAAIWSNLEQQQHSLIDLLKESPKDPDSNFQVMQIVHSLSISLTDRENLLIRSLEEKRTFNVHNARVQGETEIQVTPALMQLLNTDSFCCIPLYTRQKNIGVLLVDNFITRHPVLFEDMEFLKNLANQASYAIDNARLHRELERQVYALGEANTQLKDQQEALIEAERLGTIGKMAATVAHEIRNPLSTIGGFAHSLLTDLQDNPSVCEDLQIIVEEVSRLEHIVRELLDYARYATPVKEEQDVNRIVEQLVQGFRKDERFHNHQIDLQLYPNLAKVCIDENQIKQVLINLFLNAAQAMADGGLIRVQTASQNGMAMIRVIDTGCGIPDELKGKVFQPFFTTKTSGTGLGLNIAAQIISAHGGEISFESSEEMGTNFQILLPFCSH